MYEVHLKKKKLWKSWLQCTTEETKQTGFNQVQKPTLFLLLQLACRIFFVAFLFFVLKVEQLFY